MGVHYGFEKGTSGYIDFTCYGYFKGKNGLEINPKEAKIIKRIFNLRADGKSLGYISKYLEKKQIFSPTGKPT